MNDTNKRPVDIIESGLMHQVAPSSTRGSVAQNKNHQSTPSWASFGTGTQMQNASVTLDLDLISSDVDLKEYWNAHCEANQSIWWLPHQTESHGQGIRSSNMSSNFREVQSNFWKKTIAPISSTSVTSFRISLLSATPAAESAVVKGTRKVRVFPKNEKLLLEFIIQQRRAYNQAIACFIEVDKRTELRNHPDYTKVNLRRTIRDFVRSEVLERGGVFRSADCDESVVSAFVTRDAVIKKRKSGASCGYSFKSMKDATQSLIQQRLTPKFVRDNFDLSECLPEEAFGKLTRIIFERGQWFICAQKQITTIGQGDIQATSIVALDPGVRDFMTAYSMNQSITYGSQFYSDKVFPLLLDLDKLYGSRQKAKNSKADQWIRHYQKKIDRLHIRIRNLIDDLHRRVAYDLVMRHDVILLPTFEVQQMSSRVKRKIRAKTVRSMLRLGHYRFKKHLEWMCRKYGKRLVIVNESYTSKTRSWDGVVNSKLGGAKTISDGHIVVDRDANGARGIMLRALYGNLDQNQVAA